MRWRDRNRKEECLCCHCCSCRRHKASGIIHIRLAHRIPGYVAQLCLDLHRVSDTARTEFRLLELTNSDSDLLRHRLLYDILVDAHDRDLWPKLSGHWLCWLAWNVSSNSIRKFNCGNIDHVLHLRFTRDVQCSGIVWKLSHKYWHLRNDFRTELRC